MATLPLDNIVNVTVDISPVATVRSGFDLGLIIGSTTAISSSERVKLYSNVSDMIADGFTSTDPEYLAATLYFAQSSRPTQVAIGRWDKTGSETVVDAVTVCREKNKDWYAVTVLGAVKTEIEAVAAYLEGVTPKATYFYTTSDADVKTNADGNIAVTMKAKSYKRSLGQYSSHVDAVASIMGYAMGANTGKANTAYDLAYKKEPGVDPELLSSTEVKVIEDNNMNVYINRGSTYNLFEKGVMADGTHFDEVIGLDMLSNDIQTAVMNTLTGARKIPQTDSGVTLLINSIMGACENAVNRGFLASGTWNGPQILNLETGDTLSKGYLILSEPISSQSQEDRDSRVAPPIYVAVKLAGSIESVVIKVNVNR